MSGNNCDHYVTLPRFYEQPPSHKKRSFILEDAKKTLEKLYYRPKEFFRKFSLPKNRLKRSERRESILCVLQFFVHYMELSTGRIVKEDSKFNNFSMIDICKQTKLTFSRAKRAITDIVKAGYLKLFKQFKYEEGKHKGRPSLRILLPSLFVDLGIDMCKFNFSKHWKQSKINKRKFGSIFHKIVKKCHGLKQSLISAALSKHRLNPIKSPSDYLRELTKKTE